MELEKTDTGDESQVFSWDVKVYFPETHLGNYMNYSLTCTMQMKASLKLSLI